MLSMEGSAPREERRVVTALFADLVGSTALGERLDPEELKLIVADAVARMIGVIESFDGTVKDLAGDGVLALFGPETHALTRSSFEWSDPQELSLKGKAEPVAARRAISDLGVSRTRGLEGATSRLVGRDRELASARELVSSVLEGSGGVLYLVGEPGIGKTRLLSEIRAGFERSKPEHGRALWIEGRCVSYGESMPYWP